MQKDYPVSFHCRDKAEKAFAAAGDL